MRGLTALAGTGAVGAMPVRIRDEPAEILRAAALDVVPYGARHAALARRLGIDLSATVFALDHIPLCLERARHPPHRRAIAELIAAGTPALRAELPALVARHFAPFFRPGRIEALAEAVQPCVAAMLSRLAGFELGLAPDTLVSRIFSQALGPARRLKMEEELRGLLARIRAAHPAADAAETGSRLALAILGHDALTGTLAASLAAMLPQDAPRPLAGLAWEATPPRTGVPYIDRQALEDVCVGARAVAAGETVRARLDRYEAEPAAARGAFFGAGAHLCLGRPLSLDLWAELAARMREAPTAARLIAAPLRRDDVFHMPERLEVEVTLA